MHWYFDAWKQYVQFSGRASREAFWMFFFLNCFVSVVFIVLEIFLELSWKVEAIYSVLVFLPILSLTVRRLHDTNRSAWWLLVVLIPAVGMVLLLILLALPSEADNDDMDYPQSKKKRWIGENNENC